MSYAVDTNKDGIYDAFSKEKPKDSSIDYVSVYGGAIIGMSKEDFDSLVSDKSGLVYNKGLIYFNPELDEASLSLSTGQIGVNFYFDGLDSLVNTGAYVSLNGVKNTISSPNSGVKWVYSYNVNAKEMGDKIKIEVFDKDNNKISLNNSSATDGVFYYSVEDYLDSVKTKDNDLGNLAKAMTDYGLCAQYYFGYNAPASLPDIDTVNDYHQYLTTPTGTLPTGVKYVGSSLLLNSSTTVRHYFKVEAGVNVTFTVDAVAIEPATAGRLCYIDVTNINAVDLSKAHVLEVSDGNSTYNMSYSALTYCGKVKESSKDATLKTLADSLYLYNSAAKTYFENN